ncbi:MAG: TadE/TadG family type IV pilus assembly protein [Pseudomonadota bacterium]
MSDFPNALAPMADKPGKHAERAAKPAPKRRRFLRRFRRDDSGTATIEFAFVAIPLLTMIIGTMEVGIGYFADRTLNAGVDNVARKIRTGEIKPNTMNHSQFKQLLCDEPVMLLFDCGQLMVTVEEVGSFRPKNQPVRDANGNLVYQPTFQPGGRLSINVVQAYYEWPTMLNFMEFGIDGKNNATSKMSGNFKRVLNASNAFMNEPY